MSGPKLSVLVCGDRYWGQKESKNQQTVILEALKLLTKESTVSVIHGGAMGADYYAGKACQELKLPCEVFKADWVKYGKAAGPIRNKQMLDKLMTSGSNKIVLAFHDNINNSKGTKNTITQAKNLGIKTMLINSKGVGVIL